MGYFLKQKTNTARKPSPNDDDFDESIDDYLKRARKELKKPDSPFVAKITHLERLLGKKKTRKL